MNGMTDEKKLFHAVVDVINQTCEDDMAACCPETEITRDTDLKQGTGCIPLCVQEADRRVL